MNSLAHAEAFINNKRSRREAALMFGAYQKKLTDVLEHFDWTPVVELGEWLWDCWCEKLRVFICGNGGSAANACHLANDFIYGIDIPNGYGLMVEALPANTAVMSCLANDTGYDNVFAQQIKVKANRGDVLIVLSGSGNSANVVNAIDVANAMGLQTAAILGFEGGQCKEKAHLPIHFEIDDMQISEDTQVMVGHMLMQWLAKRKQCYQCV